MKHVNKDLPEDEIVESESPVDISLEDPDIDDLDLPPEFCCYKDEGCALAPSCLNCPFPQCMYDNPRGGLKWIKSLRDKEILRLFHEEGKEIKELAVFFNISQRTVRRAVFPDKTR